MGTLLLITLLAFSAASLAYTVYTILYPKEQHPISDDDLVCSTCGSDDVELRAWVHCKTQRVDDSGTEIDSDDDTWCNVCEDHTGLQSRISFREETEE